MKRNKKICIFSVILLIILILGTIFGVKTHKNTKLIQLTNNSKSQMMGYVIKTDNNKIIVIDGGTDQDTENLITNIKKYGTKVDAWFITHPHQDHASGIINVLENNSLDVDKIYVSLNDKDWYEKYGAGRENETFRLIDALEKDNVKDKVEEVSLNEEITIDNVKCKILGIKNPEITENAINNSSMIIKMDTGKNTVLFLGDTGEESSKKVIQNQKENLKADIVQVAHHGQRGATEELYDLVNPKICLWPTTDWLWNNDSGNGEDSGNFKTKETRSWFDKLNIKLNVVAKNGNIAITI